MFRNYPGAKHGSAYGPVNFTRQGWLPRGATKLQGNNSHTYSDVDDNNEASESEEIRDFNNKLVPFKVKGMSFCKHFPCSWNPDKPFSWQTNRAQNATQVFYFVNKFHDHLLAKPIGFTEAAGNFEHVNSSKHGKGHDAVQHQTMDGASTDNGLPDGNHVDNANMRTPPDGSPPTMQMYLQHQPGTSYPAGDPFPADQHRRRGLARLPRVHPRPVQPAGRRRPGHSAPSARSRQTPWARRGATGTPRTPGRATGSQSDKKGEGRSRRCSSTTARESSSIRSEGDRLHAEVAVVRAAPAARPVARAATPTPTTARSSASPRCTPTARSGPRPSGRCATRSAPGCRGAW